MSMSVREATLTLESIARALADAGEPIDGEYGDCMLCGKQTEVHGSDCPWRRAREWVAAHPPIER